MESHPSHVQELIMHQTSAYQGLVDASKWRVGGVWFSGMLYLQPFIWYFQWPQNIAKELCSVMTTQMALSPYVI